MNIFVGKLGRTVFFNPERFSAIGGDNECSTLILKMAAMHPEDKFYIVQCSDFSETPYKHKYPNIIPLMDGFDMKVDNHTYLYEKIKRMNIKPDYMVLYNGITSTNNIQGIYYKNRSQQMAYTKTLQFSTRYMANIVWMLNHFMDVPYMLLVPDPRYYPLMARDIEHVADHVLTQYTYSADWIFREYETRQDHITTTHPVYAGIENVFLLNKKRAPREMYINHPTPKMMNIILNQGQNSSGGLDRYPILKEYVLDNFKDTEWVNDIAICGEWRDEVMVDPRFKGPIRIEKLSKLLMSTRYTFIIPVDKNWATAKFAEMSFYGIITFMHPYYDTQKNIKCPEFLRVKSPEDLKKKIEFLERNEDARKKLLADILESFGPEWFDGTEIIENQIYKRIREDRAKKPVIDYNKRGMVYENVKFIGAPGSPKI